MSKSEASSQPESQLLQQQADTVHGQVIAKMTGGSNQQSDTVHGQIIAKMTGGMNVGQLTVYVSQMQMPLETVAEKPQPSKTRLGANPYQGLLAFQETDGDRFFGRDAQINQLWQQFRGLFDHESTTRILTIYGPSGSGKSSLARAGLIPKLGEEAIPGYTVARVVSLLPGTHPIEALSTVLARIVTQDATPVAKQRE
ncbi:MAG: ATP-binding protein, partial [Leptolyngbyaceae bacterium]|nr:ATP-binding protein [Leptolyngbyaceae bacterium]